MEKGKDRDGDVGRTPRFFKGRAIETRSAAGHGGKTEPAGLWSLDATDDVPKGISEIGRR